MEKVNFNFIDILNSPGYFESLRKHAFTYVDIANELFHTCPCVDEFINEFCNCIGAWEKCIFQRGRKHISPQLNPLNFLVYFSIPFCIFFLVCYFSHDSRMRVSSRSVQFV